MKLSLCIAFIAATLVTLNRPIQAWAQQIDLQDPIAVEQQLLRWQMQDMARRRSDDERERIARQQEEAYDREMCVGVGFRGPDVDQCIRDSALYRRRGVDFSAYGTASEAPRSRPNMECVTLGDGLGGGITDCY